MMEKKDYNNVLILYILSYNRNRFKNENMGHLNHYNTHRPPGPIDISQEIGYNVHCR